MLGKIVEKLNKAKKIAIFTHLNPDGDALGSSSQGGKNECWGR